MKITPAMFFETEKNLVHCEAANGQDYTLCGFTLDQDQGAITEVAGTKINCPDCINIIEFSQSIRKSAIRQRASSAAGHGDSAWSR